MNDLQKGFVTLSKETECPFVSIVLPCRNEGGFIEKCLGSVLANNYPKDKTEIIIVDGMSDDGTNEIVEKYRNNYNINIKLICNKKRIYPSAVNLGIKEARGEVVFIMGVHATYPVDYISKCLMYMQRYNADNVGGRLITLPRRKSYFGESIVSVLSDRFGVGNSTFRIGTDKPTWVDTVFGGCYKKRTFERIGYFNENLVSSSDMEFNVRLKKNGGKILLAPDIYCYYYTRSDLKSFCQNNVRNGFWAIYPLKYTRYLSVRLRHFIPLCFVSSVMILSLLSRYSIFKYFLLFIIGAYACLNIYHSARMALRERNVGYLFIMPVMFTVLHITYAIGSMLGMFWFVASMKFRKKKLKRSCTALCSEE